LYKKPKPGAMHKLLNTICLRYVFAIIIFFLSLVLFSQPSGITERSEAIIFEENFDGLSALPANWGTLIEAGWDMIFVQNDMVSFFKQSTGSGLMILTTPMLDLTTATELSFDFQSPTAPTTLKVGLMTDPNNAATFQQLTVFTVDSNMINFQVPLGTVAGNHHIAFNWVGAYFNVSYLDNILVIDDQIENNVPAAVENPLLEADPAGASGGTLSWVNPSLEADGDPLTDLDSIMIKLNDIYYGSVLNPPIGLPQNIDIVVPEPGYFTASLIPYNTAGEGTSNSTEDVWLATVSWSPPFEGAHGGFYNGVVSQYMVTRADGQMAYVPGTDTSFTEEVTNPGTYNYEVIAQNATGNGTPAESNTGVFLIPPYLLWEDFWVSVPAYQWTILGNNDFNYWNWNTNNAGGTPPELVFQGNNNWIGISRMVSPVLNTTGLTSLTLEFRNIQDWISDSYEFRVETSADGGTTWNTTWSTEVTGDIPAELKTLILNTEDVGSATFRFAFTFEGVEANIMSYAIDDVRLYPTQGVDLAIIFMPLPDIIEPGDLVQPQAVIQSLSTETESCTGYYTIETSAGIVYSDSIETTIVSGAYDTLNFTGWVAGEGEFLAKSRIYCAQDENPANDILFRAFVSYLTYVRLMVICEEATGTWCTYCPGAAMGLEQLEAQEYPVGVIAYHGGDSYETLESVYRIDYYPAITGYPTVMFDGVESYVGGSHSQSMFSHYVPLVEKRMNMKTPVSVSITDQSLEDNTLNASVNISSLSSIKNDHLVLHAVLTESHIPESWQDMSELNSVERSMYGGASGASIDLSDKGEDVYVQFNINASWVVENLELIVFVQDTLSREIHNGDRIKLVGTDETSGIKHLIYPNPATEKLFITALRNSRVGLLDLTGKPVLSADHLSGTGVLNISELKPGLYILTIKTEEDLATFKVNIIH